MKRGLKYGLPLMMLIIYMVPAWRYAVYGPSAEATVVLDDGQTTLSYQLQSHFASEPTRYLVLSHGPWPWQQLVWQTDVVWNSAGGTLVRTAPGKYVVTYSTGRALIDVSARTVSGTGCNAVLHDVELAGRFEPGNFGPFLAVNFEPAKAGERIIVFKSECQG